ncbi:hypothetical protein [Plastoroseomonas arctica]|uniref:AAA+ ATPase domain-containing protein n=1 Tax=Plastoroseomonas arctica TaxID=1509237 RepID=A0AAF1JZN3_9PROT|nr:hypothetical protein [Plastoroseomonas arctica]MBR0656965.1 hypothetical protein [Plastoroseomonas arctica]
MAGIATPERNTAVQGEDQIMGATNTRSRANSHSPPFEPPPSAADAFQHNGWKQARSSVLKALAEGGLVILAAPHGAGKTLLLQDLERTLRSAGVKVSLEGREAVATSIAPDVVRLVDDADPLDEATLFSLAMLGKATVLGVLPPAADRMAFLPGRVSVTRLAPLSRAEVDAFVAAGLAAAGLSPDAFGVEAIDSLAALSEGLPGRLNLLGQASLLQAQLDQASQVQAEHVIRAAEISAPGGATRGPAAARRVDLVPLHFAEGIREPLAAAVPPMRRRRPSFLVMGGLAAALVLAVAAAALLPHARSRDASTAIVAEAGSGTNAARWIARRRPDPETGRMPWAPPPAAERTAPTAVADIAAPQTAERAPEPAPVAVAEASIAPDPGGPSTPPSATMEPAPPTADASRSAPADPPAPAPSERDAAVEPAIGSPSSATVPPAATAPPEVAPTPAGRGATVGPVIAAPSAAVRAEPERAMAGTFRGTTFNETLGRRGGLQLVVTPVGRGEDVVVRFDAYRGLIGRGQLAGRLTPAGRLSAAGVLMMGRTPFKAEINATIADGTLSGTAVYVSVTETGVRPTSSSGTFRLARDEP